MVRAIMCDMKLDLRYAARRLMNRPTYALLAVVTLALSLSRHADSESAQTRLVSGTTWDIVELLVTGAATRDADDII